MAKRMPEAASVVAPSSDRTRNLTAPWAAGQSGNPGGRSKTEAEIATLARMHAPRMVELLMEIAESKRQAGTARVMAMQELFNRGFGKAPQRVLVQTDSASMDNPALQAFIQGAVLTWAKTIEGEAEDSDEPA